MVLRTEQAGDRADKEASISHEVQLGVSGFDEAVYIDSDAPAAEVKRVLAREGTRDAIAWFLESKSPDVKFTGSAVTASLPMAHGGFDTDQLLLALEALVLMARGGGPRGAAVPRRGESLVVAALGAALLAGGALLFVHLQWKTALAFPALLLLLCGFALGAATTGLAGRLVSGDSGSGARARSLTLLLFLFGCFGGASVGVTANGLLGSGEKTVLHGAVVRVGSEDTDDHTWATTLRWEDGSEQTLPLSSPERPGRKVTRTRLAGALVPWGERLEFR